MLFHPLSSTSRGQHMYRALIVLLAAVSITGCSASIAGPDSDAYHPGDHNLPFIGTNPRLAFEHASACPGRCAFVLDLGLTRPHAYRITERAALAGTFVGPSAGTPAG